MTHESKHDRLNRPLIRFQEPEFPPLADIGRYFERAQKARWFSNFGPCHELLEQRVSDWLPRDVFPVFVGNGTLGLMVALRALGGYPEPPKNKVLVPSYTFTASVNAIIWSGMIPVFVDVDAADWHLSPTALSRALEARRGRIAVVMACSTFGTPPSCAVRRAWETSCANEGVPLLVDSAAGFGAVAEDARLLGGQGDAELFSFHATKPFAAGEGGMICTRDKALAARMKQLTNFGLDQDRIVCEEPGLNAKLSELHAASALAVLDRYSEILTSRRRTAGEARSELEPHGYRFQAGAERSTWQFIPVVAPSRETRQGLLDQARDMRVEVRTYFQPLHHFPAYRACERADALVVTEWLGELTLSLPLANRMSDEASQRVRDIAVRAARDASDPIVPEIGPALTE